MTTPAELAAKCAAMADAISDGQRTANRRTARLVPAAWYAQAGLRPGSVVAAEKVAVISEESADRGSTELALRWAGPVHLVNAPTRAHPITPRRGRLSGVRGVGALRIGANVRSKVRHPGTAGRRFWPLNVATARAVATSTHEQQLPEMLQEAGFR